MSDTPRRILVYLAIILVFAAVSVWLRGEPVERGNVVAALIFAPVAAVLVWLRWDHSPAKRRAMREEERKQRQ